MADPAEVLRRLVIAVEDHEDASALAYGPLREDMPDDRPRAEGIEGGPVGAWLRVEAAMDEARDLLAHPPSPYVVPASDVEAISDQRDAFAARLRATENEISRAIEWTGRWRTPRISRRAVRARLARILEPTLRWTPEAEDIYRNRG